MENWREISGEEGWGVSMCSMLEVGGDGVQGKGVGGKGFVEVREVLVAVEEVVAASRVSKEEVRCMDLEVLSVVYGAAFDRAVAVRAFGGPVSKTGGRLCDMVSQRQPTNEEGSRPSPK